MGKNYGPGCPGWLDRQARIARERLDELPEWRREEISRSVEDFYAMLDAMRPSYAQKRVVDSESAGRE